MLCDLLIDGTTTGRGFALDAVAAAEGVEPDDVEVLRCLQGQLLEHDGILRSLAELDAATTSHASSKDEPDAKSAPTSISAACDPMVIHPSGVDPPPRQRVPRLGHGVRAKVLVEVPVLTLLDHDDEPAMLEGYGPIAPDVARRLAAHAPSFTRILTHPETGAVLSVGRDSYAVPADLRIWLRVRDGTCRFPGCEALPARCEIDRGRDWALSRLTEHDNLAHLCPSHHHLKHHTAWTVEHEGNGELDWRSPLGLHHRTAPERAMRPTVVFR